MTRRLVGLLLLLTGIVVGSFCIVILDEREQAFRTLLNNPNPILFGLSLNQAVLTEPGWYLRIPGLHQFRRYEKRLIRFDAEPRTVYLSQKLKVEVDYFALWKVADPQQFFESIRTYPEARGRLDTITDGEMRQVLGRYRLVDLLSDKRAMIMREVTTITVIPMTVA